MKQTIAKIISSTVLSIAKNTSSATCEWRTFQPKVPMALLEQAKSKKV